LRICGSEDAREFANANALALQLGADVPRLLSVGWVRMARQQVFM